MRATPEFRDPRLGPSARLLAAILTASALAKGASAQAVPPREIQTVTIDVTSERRAIRVPFMEHFLLSVPVVANAKTIRFVARDPNGRTTISMPIAIGTQHADAKTVAFYVPEIPPNRELDASLEYWFGTPTQANCTAPLGPDLSSTVPCGVVRYSLYSNTSFTSHFDFDLGVVRSANAGYTGLLVAVHVHPVPLNDNTPDYLRGIGHRVSAFAGLAITDFGTEEPIQKPIAAGVPVVGLGVKVGPTRLLGGVMFFDQVDANPVVDEKRAKFDYIVGISLDFAVKEILGLLGSALGVK